MKVNPQHVVNREELNLRLGIKCSLPEINKLLAVTYTIYAAIKKSEIIFVDEFLNSSTKTAIKLKSEYETLVCDFYDLQINTLGIDRNTFLGLFNNTPLFNQHLESLQVALQLYWKLGEVNFEDSSKANTSERKGGNRYSKKINFSTNIDLIELSFSNEENILSERFKSLLFEIITNQNSNDETVKTKLSKLLSTFTEEATFKIRVAGEEIVFQQIGVYEEIILGNTVESNDSIEQVGPLRVLKSSLSDNLNYYIEDNKIEGFKINTNTSIDELKDYSKRVKTKLNLSPKSTNIEIIMFENDESLNYAEVPIAKNIIYYGSPGTGKSHRIKEIVKGKEEFTERVTFHPEYDYTSFVGGYKPTSKDGDIKYEFAPQVFTNIYVKAWNDLNNNEHFLVIEEINRGNCAEIFGDIFQLLDRNPEYLITPSDELKNYLEKNLTEKGVEGIAAGKMKLPENLTILASMNTSDQSLFPMDSAFKRRWDWEYIPICYDQMDDFKKKNESFDFEIDIEDGNKYSWLKFIEAVNLNHIKNNASLGMDKCLGNYFIKPDNANTISLKPFINKVIFYLWNDVFKDEENKVFEENTSYEDFFPIKTKGKEKIKELFERIELKPKVELKVVEAHSQLGQVAEGKEEIES